MRENVWCLLSETSLIQLIQAFACKQHNFILFVIQLLCLCDMLTQSSSVNNPPSGVAGPYSRSTFSCSRCLHSNFHSGQFTLPPTGREQSVLSASLPAFVVYFLMAAILTGLRWNLSVVLMTSEVACIFFLIVIRKITWTNCLSLKPRQNGEHVTLFPRASGPESLGCNHVGRGSQQDRMGHWQVKGSTGLKVASCP